MRRGEDDERAGQALVLRRSGAPWTAIAERLDYESASTACRAVRRLLEATAPTADDVDAERQLLVDRLDALLLRVWPLATGVGDREVSLDAVAEAVKIIDRQARLGGLYRPRQIELSGRVDVALLTPVERRELLADAVREAARRGAIDVAEIASAIEPG
jgi:hypothetical protein